MPHEPIDLNYRMEVERVRVVERNSQPVLMVEFNNEESIEVVLDLRRLGELLHTAQQVYTGLTLPPRPQMATGNGRPQQVNCPGTVEPAILAREPTEEEMHETLEREQIERSVGIPEDYYRGVRQHWGSVTGIPREPLRREEPSMEPPAEDFADWEPTDFA